MSPGATVGADDSVRLFLALEVPDDVSQQLRAWGEHHLDHGRRVDTYHVTLAFLGRQPRAVVDPVADVMRHEAAAIEPFQLAIARYRETRSVGMLVLDDPSGRASTLATRIHVGLEEIGAYERERRPWLPHLTVLRFRERPRLAPPLPEIAAFAPSGVAALLSRLHRTGARYEVLQWCPLGG
ncbi:MAG TPA: 2'-5' RNA ligase family protein [Gaiellaceae bacterium]|nr:2'-5' RNA ligase family protein [Gaiellaceae bacterium]